jgi:hypothetical protein
VELKLHAGVESDPKRLSRFTRRVHHPADSGVKRNIPGRYGNALAMNGNSGWRARCQAGRI